MPRHPTKRRRNPWDGFSYHAMVFVSVISVLVIRGDVPSWAMWWGLGLAFHLVSTVRKARALSDSSAPEPTSEVTPAPTTQADSASVAEPVQQGRSELVDAVLKALAELKQAWVDQEAAGTPPDFAGLTDIARAMDERLQSLRALTERGGDLPEQVAAAQARVDAAQSQVEAETYERELDALEDRLSAHQAALSVVRMLEAELRTLLHRVEGLRLDVEQRSVDRPKLDDRAQEIREQLQAASEVDEHLARARRAARARIKGS